MTQKNDSNLADALKEIQSQALSQEQMNLLLQQLIIQNNQILKDNEVIKEENSQLKQILSSNSKELIKNNGKSNHLNDENDNSLILDEKESNLDNVHIKKIGEYQLVETKGTQYPDLISDIKSDKNHEMKNMVASHLDQFTHDFGFKNDKRDWYSLGHKVQLKISLLKDTWSKGSEKRQEIYEKVSEKFESIAKDLNVHVKTSRNKISEFQEDLFLVGEKRAINKLQRKFSHTLQLFGFKAQELLAYDTPVPNLNHEQVQIKVDESLEHRLKIKKTENDYALEAMTGLDDNLKSEMIHKMIWPKLVESINESMDMNRALAQIANNNKYIKMVTKFARENNVHRDIIIHTLTSAPEMLDEYKESAKLLNNRANILANCHKYEIFAENNLTILKSLVKAASDIQSSIENLNIEEPKKASLLKEISETKMGIHADNKEGNSFEFMKKVVNKAVNEQKNSTSLIQQRADITETMSKPKMM